MILEDPSWTPPGPEGTGFPEAAQNALVRGHTGASEIHNDGRSLGGGGDSMRCCLDLGSLVSLG